MCAWLLSVALAQSEAETWLERLGADDPAVRDAATEWLAENGEPVRNRLEALAAGDDPERAARARTILPVIDKRVAFRAAADPFSGVTIEATDASAVDVLRRIRGESGLPLRLRRIPLDARVTVRFLDTPPLEAVLAVCRETGGIAPGASFDEVLVAPGSPELAVVGPRGRLAVVLGQIWRAWHSGGSMQTEIGFWVVWGTRRPPFSVRIELDELRGSGGPLFPSAGRWQGVWARNEGQGHLVSVYLQDQAVESLEWITARGVARARWATEWSTRDTAWANVTSEPGVRLDGIPVRLVRDGDELGVWRPGGESDEAWARVEIMGVDAAGGERKLPGANRVIGGTGESMSAYRMEGLGDVTIRVRYPVGFCEQGVPFAFERVPLTPQ